MYFSMNQVYCFIYTDCFVFPLIIILIYLAILKMFYLNSTLKFGMPTSIGIPVKVYYKVDSFLTALTAQQKGTTAQWYSNKKSLLIPINSFPNKSQFLVLS